MLVEALDRTATLLVVDVQALTLPNARSVPSGDLLERIGQLTDGFRRTGRPVAYAITTGMRGGRTDRRTPARSWPEDALSVPDVIGARAGEVCYERTGWSAFSGTNLVADLRRRRSTQLVVTGLATSFGVESTVRAGYDLGFDLVVPVDAVSDPDAASHEQSVTHVFPLLAETTSTEMVLRLLADPGA
ncbi:cysteine hydrolase family protein [Microlunatus antarcticus]|uniref:Nicotinamidase-related amidase n=1 Tax=Microlunatus antarcticus TaxID=53388 RepID=A0A7W5JX34_9ACTN|nr:cysteine hydrolase [Microlunatus antarcticus]MBB3327835.1 nicotinamidase-related amidase [Microlunatus antarcticus]